MHGHLDCSSIVRVRPLRGQVERLLTIDSPTHFLDRGDVHPWAYFAFSEAFNLAILRAFEKEGIQFSLPSRVAHTSRWSEKEPIDLCIVEQGDGGTDRGEPATT